MKRLKFFNSLHHKIEEFIPLVDEGKKDFVGIYSCGPTVYGDPHIGNIRAYFLADILGSTIRKILGYNVKHVVNITDVGHLAGDCDNTEDKMEIGSKRENLSSWEIAKKYTQNFFNYLDRINVKFDHYPRATDYIQEQLEIVKDLEKKGLTYIIHGDGVYLDTSKIENYGELIGENLEKYIEGLQKGARVDDVGKKNPTDFALWKLPQGGKHREMIWDSPWGDSFPGWHIECSAMSRALLGDNFDIHTGGMDHVCPHHTNEIVQSENSFAKRPWVNYWVHIKFLTLNGKRIGKSEGNSIEVYQIFEKGFSGEDLRFLFLHGKYNTFQDFSWNILEQFKTSRQNFIEKIGKLYKKVENIFEYSSFENIVMYEDFENILLQTSFGKDLFDKLIDALLEDLNTVEMISLINKTLSEPLDKKDILDFLNIIFYFDEKILKINIYKEMIFKLNKADLEIPENIIELAKNRLDAKLQKDFKKADEIRIIIENNGFYIKDTKDGFEIVRK